MKYKRNYIKQPCRVDYPPSDDEVGMLNAYDAPLSNYQMRANQTTEAGQD